MTETRILAVRLAAALSAAAGAAAAQPPPALLPLTTVGAGGVGYLSDPQPVRLAPSDRGRMQFLSGTTKAVVGGAYPLRPGAFAWAPLQVDAADLRPAMAQAGVTVTNIQNVDIFQADDGAWHAAVTVGVSSPAHPKHWTVVAHAHPTQPGEAGAPPRAWTADTLLAGDFTHPVEGNYDGKYYEEAGRLHLLYVRNTAPGPALRNEIVLQPMRSFVEPSAGGPVTLLTPGDRDGELESERYANTPAKLVEAPWIAVVGGKHALIYSTGAYLTPGYKAGVAWSDGLLPLAGGRYRKVLQPDPANLWGSGHGREVRYLVQSARPREPGFTGGSVIGPGVAAAVQGPGGAWWLYLNGFAPGDMPRGPNGQVDGAHRRPYALRLRAAVPPGAPVAGVSDAELAGWLQPGAE